MARDFDWGPTRSSHDKMQEFVGWFLFVSSVLVVGALIGRWVYSTRATAPSNASQMVSFIEGDPRNLGDLSQNHPQPFSESNETLPGEKVLFSENQNSRISEESQFTSTPRNGMSLELEFKNQWEAQAFLREAQGIARPVYLVHESEKGKWRIVAGQFDSGKEELNLNLATQLLTKMKKLPGADKIVKAEYVEVPLKPQSPNREKNRGVPPIERVSHKENHQGSLFSEVQPELVHPQESGPKSPKVQKRNPPGESTSLSKTQNSQNSGESAGFVIQVGAFSLQKFADSIKTRLEKAGFDTLPYEAKAGQPYKVQVGPYMVRESVEKELSKIEKMGLKGLILTF